MAYQSLYRRYRSRRFAEVLGQDQVVGALRNAVRDDRVGHAYLFSGPRGTGKTSTARILAKALNCTDLRDGEPCCECDSCLSIEAGTSYDLQELDAASNNKVENVRDLIERVALGSPGRTKVYILDEVHMLSAGASNALLKTLEDPPPHVVFVLATTDPHKVLPTIRSRTQHFEFHLLPADVLADHVRFVIGDAGLDVGPDGIEQVVRQGGGSARDTLSALDQVAAAGGITESTEHAEALVDAVCTGDTGLALRSVAEAVEAGRDPRLLGEALLGRLRDAFLVRMGAPLPQATEIEQDQAKRWADQLTDRSTTRALEEVGAALLEMRQAPDPRIPLEVALVRLTRPVEGTDVGALIDRIERLERAVASGVAVAPPAGPAGPVAASPPTDPLPAQSEPAARARPADVARAALAKSKGPADQPPCEEAPAPQPAPPPPAMAPAPVPASVEPEPEREPPADAAAAGGLSDDAFRAGWNDAVLPALKGMAGALFRPASFVGFANGTATLSFENDATRDNVDRKRAEVEQAATGHFGQKVKLQLTVGGAPGSTPTQRVPSSSSATSKPDPEPEAEEIVDVHALEDVPLDPRTGVDRITEAFPGAEVLTEPPG